MSNNENEKKNKVKIKRLKRMFWLIGGLTGLFTVLVLSFFILIITSGSSEPAAPETPVSTSVFITPRTEVYAYEVCARSGRTQENEELVEEIRNLEDSTLIGLQNYLISIDKSQDHIKEFTSNKVVVQYEIENCETCLDGTYLVVQDSQLVFYDGIPGEDNQIGVIEDEVIIIDRDQKHLLTEGIRLEDSNLYLGIHTSMSLAVYYGKPGDVKPPLFTFQDLKVRADLINFLEEEEPFNSKEDLLALMESYSY